MRTHRVALVLVPVSLLLAGTCGTASGFDIDTHRVLNGRAADASTLKDYLPGELGLSLGLDQTVDGRTVRSWIERGGAAEDQFRHSETLGALFRSRHHFHNPLQPWNVAGLQRGSWCPPFRLVGQASVRWAQNPDQGLTGKASWLDARQRFLEALTLGTQNQRETAFGQTFQILGQQTHLIEDMAVPAHTRNDPHCPTPEGFERWASRNASLVADLAATPIRPAPEIFLVGVPLSDDVARVPVARLWDTERYRLLQDPNVTLVGPIGLAEYSNANFFSDDTIFSGFPFPAPTSVALGPAEPGPITGQLRRYFKKVQDGELIDHLAVPSALFDALPAALKDRRKGLDEKVFRDYATLLIPRAVGYSAALLDYFFRGKLDVDLVDDGSGLRLAGANASPDPLDGGTLAVYADGTDGVRRLASAAVAVGRIEAGGVLPAVSVTPPPGADRFVAVYTGTLGEERATDTFKGAVIGKVLGGVRVEEVFSDGTRWQLRTPQGVFPLPIPAGGDNVVELRWGDRDNTLVGRTDLGPGRPNLLLAYQIKRPAGSVTVPLLMQPDGSRVVDVQETSRKSFPVGLYLGTTIQFSHTIQYRRYLTTLVPTVEYEFDGLGYTFKRVADVQAHLDLVINDAQTLRRSDPVTLGWVTEPYNWYVAEIGLTADGKILALVGVWLTSPRDQGAVFAGPFDRPEEIPYEFPPMYGYLWALLNVTDGTVVGGKSTAPPELVIDHTTTVTRGGGGAGWYTGETVTRYVGGPNPPPETREPGVPFAPGLCDTPPARLLGEVLAQNETSAITVVQYRPELAGRQFADPARLPAPDRTEYWGYLCGQPQSVGIAVRVRTSEFTLSRLDTAFRAPGDGTGEQLTLFMAQSQPQLRYWDFGKVLTWFPERTTAELRAELTRPALHYLQAASRQAALVITDVYEPDFDETTSLVALTGDPAVQVFAAGLWDFRLLAPSYLYNPFDLKFYRLAPPLTATALPATLSGASGNPIGEYHAVRLQ